MIDKLSKIAKKTELEVKWWKWAAWTSPFTALSILIFEHWVGNDTWIRITMLTITVIFFTVSVMWWWWALYKIKSLLNAFSDTDDKFNKVAKELKEIKKEIKKGL